MSFVFCFAVAAETEKALQEFGEQVDAKDKEKVQGLLTELREMSTKGQAGDESVKADDIKNKIGETQQASLGLFQKVGVPVLSSLDLSERC